MTDTAVIHKDARFAGRLGIMQIVMPKYREGLLREIAGRCDEGLHVFYGSSLDPQSVQADKIDFVEMHRTRNRSFLSDPVTLNWQDGVVQWLERTRPDAIICEANPRFLSHRRAIAWMKRQGKPILGWGLGTLMLAQGLESIRTAGRRRFLSRYDGMVCYSTTARDQYAALGLNPERLFVAYNAVAPRPTQEPPAFSQPHSGPVRLLFVGRINQGKRVDLLLDAAIQLLGEIDFEINIIGNAAPALMQELLAKAAPLGKRVTFTASLFGQALQQRFYDADVFVLPGLGGLAVQEAMCYGLPVIVAESDGSQVDLVDEQNGWHVASSNAQALATAIRQACSDRDRLVRMGRVSYGRARDTFNVENAAANMVYAAETLRKGLK